MKGIAPALNESLTNLGKSRKKLFQAIREALVECNASPEYLAKFDKLNGE